VNAAKASPIRQPVEHEDDDELVADFPLVVSNRLVQAPRPSRSGTCAALQSPLLLEIMFEQMGLFEHVPAAGADAAS